MKRYERVAEELQAQIRQGAYAPGQRIPGTRDLVKHFRVSVSTIMAAQRLLERQGWVEARSRSGYYVRTRPQLSPRPKVHQFQPIPSLVNDQRTVMELLQTVQNPDILAFGAAVPDAEFFPSLALQRAFRAALRHQGRRLDQYSFPPGLQEMREALVQPMADAWCPVEAEELVVTDGCHEALRLALRCVAKAGDIIAVESPTYYGVLQLIDALGLKVLEIPTDSDAGISLPALSLALEQWPVKAVLIMANFSNPTGATLSDENKDALVRLCADCNTALIENDVYGELGYSALRPRALKSFDQQGGVIYCSSYSKTVSPGLRVGWMAPGRWLDQACYLKFTSSLATATLPQLALVQYLRDSDHKRHLCQMTGQLMAQVEQVRQWVQAYFPVGTRMSHPSGGFVLWVELPAKFDSGVLYHRALAAGVSLAPGFLFSGSGKYRHCLRLNCALPWAPRLEGGIRLIGELVAAQNPGYQP